MNYKKHFYKTFIKKKSVFKVDKTEDKIILMGSS